MLTLYYHPGACSLAAHIVLEWIGEPYETKEVEFGDKEYLRINPAGAVPALDDDGWIVTQAAAVLHYLSRKYPQAKLDVEQSPRDLAEADRWSAFITGDLHPAFFPLFLPARYTRSREQSALEDVREAAKTQIRRKYALLDAHLSGRRWFLGGKRSYLDAYVFPMERWGANMLGDGLDAWPGVKAHHDMMGADEAAQRVLAAEGA